jgi:GT2 family glycosyltransferase
VGAALGIRADVFRAVGGFDPSSTPLIDVDLSWRLQLAGYELELVPDAVLHYRYRTAWRATFTQKRRYGAGDVLLAKRYRTVGVPRRSWKVTLRWWWEVAQAAVRVRDRRGWFLFVEQLGGTVGRLEGSVRYRYVHL